jgi:hypothetical protein
MLNKNMQGQPRRSEKSRMNPFYNKEDRTMENVILGFLLLIQTGLRVAGLRIMMTVERESREALAQSKLPRS